MLPFLDILYTILHLVVIIFNCTGWIWKRTRKLHLWVISLTTFSWFVLGYWYGWGYCFLTDWAWQVKVQLGETELPNSFIQYCFDHLHLGISPSVTDVITAVVFFISLGLSIYLNLKSRK